MHSSRNIYRFQSDIGIGFEQKRRSPYASAIARTASPSKSSLNISPTTMMTATLLLHRAVDAQQPKHRPLHGSLAAAEKEDPAGAASGGSSGESWEIIYTFCDCFPLVPYPSRLSKPWQTSARPYWDTMKADGTITSRAISASDLSKSDGPIMLQL